MVNSDEAHLTLNNILRVLKRGGVLKKEYTPFGNTEDGYADFRGIDLSNQKIVKLQIDKVDLSHSNFKSSWIEKSTLNNIIFDRVNFAEVTDKGNVFNDVSFIHCNFNKAGLGYEGSQYLNCKFDNASFTKSVFMV